MKTGIITIHNSPNYGATLQAFALWKYLQLQGYDVEIIDLYRPYQKEYVPSRKYRPRRQDQSTRSRIKEVVKKALGKWTYRSEYSPSAADKFAEFNAQMKFSRPYYGIDELYEHPPVYDLYVSGSDQVWNPEQPYCLDPYFLTFAPEGSRKISYASSIGITELTADEKADFKRWLSSYSAVSVRERQAKELLESFTGLQVSQVSDPTFLLDADFWQSVAADPVRGKPYMLLYTVVHRPYMVDYCLKVSKQAGLPLVVLGQYEPESCDGYKAVRDAGPREFLGYIADAEMVVTTSFHCTALSLLMGTKNFYSVIDRGSKRGSRLSDLLDTFGLQDHLLASDPDSNYAELASRPLHREAIRDKILSEQKRSRDFLLSNIGQATGPDSPRVPPKPGETK